ncbi:MAG: lipopolysaccharide heptosyltransferase II [Chlamydiales bacterium]
MDREYHNIIIRMPNWLGDAVMATPIIADIRKKWPEASLTAMCMNSLTPLLLGNPHLNEIFSFSQPNEFQRKQKNRHMIERLRQGKYDLGVLLTNSFSSAWGFWRGRVQTLVGFAHDARSLLLTYPVTFPKEREKQHLVMTYKSLLQPLGIALSDTSPSLYVMEEERAIAETILKQHSVPEGAQIVGVNPSAAYGPAKCWLPERFRSVTEKLLQDPQIYILYFGDKTNSFAVQKICHDLPKRVINLAGTTNLRELIALIERCNVFLTNDSGPMHIAAALKKRLIALFGSTNEITTGPYQHGKVIHKHAPCSPCYRRVCPIDFKCMKQIGVDEVTTALLKELKRPLHNLGSVEK